MSLLVIPEAASSATRRSLAVRASTPETAARRGRAPAARSCVDARSASGRAPDRSEGVAYLDTHEAEEQRLLQEWLGTPPQTTQRSAGSVRVLDIAPEDLRPYVTIARAVGTIDRDLDVRGLVWQDRP